MGGHVRGRGGGGIGARPCLGALAHFPASGAVAQQFLYRQGEAPRVVRMDEDGGAIP